MPPFTLPARARTAAALVASALALPPLVLSASAASALPTTASAPPEAAVVAPATTPKNVILLIGDGMGYNTVDLASAYQYGTTYHQVAVDPGTGTVAHQPRTASQVFQHFPVQVGVSTFSASGRRAYDPAAAWKTFPWIASGATDSAAAATALATGTKTTNGRLGIAPDGTVLENVTQRADAAGKATGVVTSVPFSHATPAGFAAHTLSRENYQVVTEEYLTADYLDVVIGAGHPLYDSAHRKRATPNYQYVSPGDWQRLVDGTTGFTLVEEKADFQALADGTLTPERVFGAVQVGSTLQQQRPGTWSASGPFVAARNDVPDLSTLARGALTVLEQDADGFFLMVEGGAIDWSGHDNSTVTVVEETIDFNRTVEAVTAWVEAESSWDETLVVVTADHETGYIAGPGANPTWTALAPAQGVVAEHGWHSGGHTNQLVPLYARGAGAAELAARATMVDPVRGAYLDNTAVARVMLDAVTSRPTPEPTPAPAPTPVPADAPAPVPADAAPVPADAPAPVPADAAPVPSDVAAPAPVDTPAPAPSPAPGREPVGNLDTVRPVPGGLRIRGWAADRDDPTTALSVDVSVGGVTRRVTTDVQRPDVPRVFPELSGPTGFDIVVPLPPGSHTACATALGVGGGADKTFPCRSAVVADTQPPTFTSGPALDLRTGTVSTDRTVPAALSWAVTDDAGPATTTLTSPTTSLYRAGTLSADVQVPAGTATWTLEARDPAGNAGSASVSRTLTLVPEQAATRGSYWWTPHSSKHLDGKVLRSNRRGASLTYTFDGRAVAWVAPKDAGSGRAAVLVDGVHAATVDLQSEVTAPRQVVFTHDFETAGEHTITIVVEGTAGRPSVSSDGFITLD